MKYNDRVFGVVDINEPVIIELINSPALQRLKKIDQAGYSKPYFSGAEHNRFEHSVEDYLLLNKFGASLNEQVAGLIHDVSHSAFSHCIDYVLNEGGVEKLDHQDNIFKDFVLQTTIPKILTKYGFAVDYILEEKNFSLQETELPDLCADRISYALLSFLMYKIIGQPQMREILKSLSVIDGRWVFRDLAAAKKFAGLFKILNEKYLAGLFTATMFKSVSDYLKYALARRYITEIDLYTDDKFVLDKINKHLVDDSELNKLWYRVNNNDWFRVDQKDYDAHLVCKSRIVDPLVLWGKEIFRLSVLEPSWREVVSQEMKPKEYYFKILK